MSFQQLSVSSQWIEAREQLHRRYEELVGLQDSSRLGFLHGPETQWTEGQVVDRWAAAANHTDRRRDAFNHVYIHVPFCKSICSFCNYERLKISSPVHLKSFTARVLRSLDAITPAVRPMTWHTIYMGGGTASVLPADQLDQILTKLDKSMRWHRKSTRSYEFDPAVFNEARLDVLVEHGFRHFSFGVQTLTAEVNIAHNRGPQSRELVAKRFEQIHARNIYNISCDFLLGLAGTTPDQIVSEIEEILIHKPRWVDLFFLVPTDAYVQTHFAGDHDAFWKHIRPFHERIPKMIREMGAKHNYEIRRGHGHNIVLYRHVTREEYDEREGVFAYTQLVDQQRRPLHLLGLGTSARSFIFGEAKLECRDPSEIGDPDGDHYYVGHQWGLEGDIRLFLAHILRENDVLDREMFERIFGLDIVDAIPLAIAVWASKGLVTLTDKEMRLKREERRDRMRTLLWLVPTHYLAFEAGRYEHNLLLQERAEQSAARQG